MITIVGGGLAGLSLGIALRRRGVPINLHEAGVYPRHRVCGEFISGVSQCTFDSLGIGDLFDDAKEHRSTAWFFRDRRILSTQLPGGLGISRFALDERLSRKFRELGGLLCERSGERPKGRRARLVREESGKRPLVGLVPCAWIQLSGSRCPRVQHVGLGKVGEERVNLGLFRFEPTFR
jgi:2-polyprenyl-6-methoxyphenol hydroxylase-like FAD-dependent oxidoreductase